ncbi:hypothetical protein VHEMI08778 [[Torrubiella] hemipterigena]|uniref:Uncharacterized protein n=1 Tax=[Torrubiella] hemipterigena TaxID=1531966 RepID=A0A0A1TEN2_9HYPO|nr:hypothetical protein VHEMI08778 [[Torrubiella] hemipterigena]
MASFSKSIFPLGDTSENDLRSLCKTLWQWKLCDGCETQTGCRLSKCPWQQSDRLETFFQYYRDSTAVFVPDCIGGMPTLQSHSDLLAIIRDIKQRPQLQRQTITQLHFIQKASSRGNNTLPSQNEQNQAFNLAVRIMAMVNSSTEDQVEGALLESGSMPVTWHGDTSFAEFMEQAFHTQDTTLQVTGSGDLFNQSTKLAKLTAKRLKRVAGLQLTPTDNL